MSNNKRLILHLDFDVDPMEFKGDDLLYEATRGLEKYGFIVSDHAWGDIPVEEADPDMYEAEPVITMIFETPKKEGVDLRLIQTVFTWWTVCASVEWEEIKEVYWGKLRSYLLYIRT